VSTPDDLRRQVRALAVRGLPLDQLWPRLEAVLRRAVPWEVAAWGTVDPATLLSTSCIVTGAPYDADRELAVFALEHDEREPGRLLDLVRRTPPVAALRASTGDRPETAPRWAALLQPLGLHDDLRLALVQAGTCWGSLYAYRRDRAFGSEEVALLGALSEPLAEAVRLCLLRDAAASGDEEAPGLLLLDAAGRATAASAAGERWLELLGGAPPVVRALAASLRAAEPGPSSARLQTLDGRWAVVHASTVSGAGAALIVEPARPVVVAEVLAAAYAFTPRERDVVGLLLRGEGNRQIARTLGISEHTVKEHVKAVFAKTGVTSRGELAAALLREQYLPRRGVLAPSPQGFFRATA
jgi:DNA-binding CsgD family transcriptional regulator